MGFILLNAKHCEFYNSYFFKYYWALFQSTVKLLRISLLLSRFILKILRGIFRAPLLKWQSSRQYLILLILEDFALWLIGTQILSNPMLTPDVLVPFRLYTSFPVSTAENLCWSLELSGCSFILWVPSFQTNLCKLFSRTSVLWLGFLLCWDLESICGRLAWTTLGLSPNLFLFLRDGCSELSVINHLKLLFHVFYLLV